MAGAAVPLLAYLPRAAAASVALGGVEVQPRAAWGGDLLPTGPLSEEAPGDVRFLLVHHTELPGNRYAAGDVPGLLRGIYGYHTNQKGWTDIAYNFLVDRFGRVWEGRTGSLNGPVKGDATGGSQGFALLACFIGDHTSEPPTPAALDSMGKLLGGLASRYGIDVRPGSTTTFTSRGSSRHPVGTLVTTATIAGHRDMSVTACPGDACYPLIRTTLVPAAAAAVAAASRKPLKEAFAFGNAGDLGSTAGGPLSSPLVGMASTRAGQGYWLVAADGGVFGFGNAPFLGSAGGTRLSRPIVGMAATPSGNGYWLVASDGGIFTYGDAQFLGSTGAMVLSKPVVGMAATPTGEGYWLVASDGGIFAFGDARFFGSMGGAPLTRPVVGMAATPSGDGYWLAASDGGVFAFGGARFAGSVGGAPLVSPVVGIAGSISGNGYRMVASDGGVFCFGDAAYLGRPDPAALRDGRAVGIATYPGGGGGYWVVATR